MADLPRRAGEKRALIKRLKRGDSRALRSVYELYHRQVYNVAFRFFGDHHLAEDITQDVFLHLFERIKGFRGESKISTYLYRVVTNFCINRAKITPSTLSLEQIPEIKARKVEGVSVEEEEKKTRVQQALLGLSQGHRAVLILKVLEGLSYKEVTEVTGLSQVQVRGRLYRARKAFKRKYDELTRKKTNHESTKETEARKKHKSLKHEINGNTGK